MGPRPLKKGAMTPLSRKKGDPTKKIIPNCTDQVFLRYRFGKYQEIPTEYQPKIPNRYCLVWATKLSLAVIGLVFPALVLGYKLFLGGNGKYHT
jgi:hypothetical protein